MRYLLRYVVRYRLYLLFILIPVLLLTSRAYLNHIFYLDFADEEDNFLLGKFILEGKRLYTDVFSQHQPITYLLSAFLQIVSSPDNILLLVKRHREFMILWSALWAILLTLRFGAPMLISTIIFELTKSSLLGNMFLAESLVVYPLMYISAFLYHFSSNRSKLELLFIACLVVFIIFNLAPLWPFAISVYIVLIARTKNKWKTVTLLFGPLLAITFALILFVPVKDYIRDVFYYNYNYYVPNTTHFSGQFSILKAIGAPIIAILSAQNSALLNVIKVTSFLFLMNLLLLIRTGKLKETGILIIILGLSALRYVAPHNELYGAFHMLPWYALLITFTLITQYILFRSSGVRIKVFSAFSIGVLLLFSLMHAKGTLFDDRNSANDYYIKYSNHESFSEALSIMKSENDTLFAVPVGNLLYWKSGIEPAHRFIFFYGWMEKVPIMRDEVRLMFEKLPPTYVWCECEAQKSVTMKYLSTYVRLFKDNNPTPLYIRKEKIRKLNPQQIEKLGFHRFAFSQKANKR